MFNVCNLCDKPFPSKSKLDRHLNSKTKCIDRINTENAKKKSKEKYGERFGYDKFIYVDAKTSCIIYCNVHKYYFNILFNNHMSCNGGCLKCSKVEHKDFQTLSNELNERYKNSENRITINYTTEKNYSGSNSVLSLICTKHGAFNITIECSKTHAYCPCPQCFIEKLYEQHIKKLQTIDKTKTKYIHPKYTNHKYDLKTDNIININSGKSLKKTKGTRGLREIHLQTKENSMVQFHRFKYEAIYNELIPENMQIDHIDRDYNNNSIENLQCLTIQEHGRKTSIDNPDRGKKTGKTQGKSGIAYNDLTKEQISFDSINDLSKKLGQKGAGNIHRFLRTGKSPPNGFNRIVFTENKTIDNEEWKTHPILKLEISNKGRIKDRRNITQGTLDHAGYYHFSGNKVHKLVAETWLNNKINDSYNSIDHIDNNTKNNCVENLRWATKSEQTLNQSCKKLLKIKQYNAYTYEIINTYTSVGECMSSLNIQNKRIHNVSFRDDWFICVHPILLNKTRLEFIRSILFYKFGRAGLTEITGMSKTDRGYRYGMKYSKFYNYHTYKSLMYSKNITKLVNDTQAKEYIRQIAITNNNAIIIQIYWRSLINYRFALFKNYKLV
jgi:hypothetical protein